MKRKKYPYPLNYRGNLFILVFSFAWPPLAAALLVKNLAVQNRERRLHLEYRGKFGWIVFWSLFCFPMALLLSFVRGFDLVEETYEK